MSNSRSPRAVRSMTIGISGMALPYRSALAEPGARPRWPDVGVARVAVKSPRRGTMTSVDASVGTDRQDGRAAADRGAVRGGAVRGGGRTGDDQPPRLARR